MKDDAINEQPRAAEDVSADEHDAAGDIHNQEPPKREMTEREKRLAEIARQHNEAHGYDYGDEAEEEAPPAEDGEPEADTEQDLDEQDADEEQEPDEAAKAAQDPLEELGYYRKADGKLYTTMKINGEEREVPADQVKAYLQKDLAGDFKLQQAAERERRLQEAEQKFREREQQFQQSLSKQQPPTQLGAEESRQQAKAVLKRIWDGDDDAAAEALADFIQQNSARMDPDQLLSEAENRAMSALDRREAEKQQKAWNESVEEGNRWLASEHSDIYADQRLFDLVNGETARLVEAQQNGDPDLANLTPRQIIERAAQDVQGWMDGRKSDKPQETTKESRAERKANLKPIPRSQSKRPTHQQPKEVDTSPAAVIARMREARSVN